MNGIPDDDPILGITDNSGQVTWTIRYDLGINVCENCGDANAQCADFESNVTVSSHIFALAIKLVSLISSSEVCIPYFVSCK